jgi:hypothetical protein
MASQMNSKEFINTFIIVSSLKYLKTFHIVKLSRWIYEELINICYSDSKFRRASCINDLEVIETIIHLVQNKDLLTYRMQKYINAPNTLKLLIKYGANIHYDNEYELRFMCDNTHYVWSYDIIKLLLDSGADVHINNERPLFNSCRNGCKDTIKLLLDNGAKVTNEILKLVTDKSILELLKRYM